MFLHGAAGRTVGGNFVELVLQSILVASSSQYTISKSFRNSIHCVSLSKANVRDTYAIGKDGR